MTEKGHRRKNAYHGLANKGEDGKKGHGLGIKVRHMDLIMGKHCVEEGGERGDQASPKSIDEDWDLGGSPVNASTRHRPSHRLSPLIEAGGKHGTHLVHGLIVEHPGTAGGALGEGKGFFPLSACFGAMTAKRAEGRSEWRRETESRGSRGIGEARRRRRGITV